MKLLSLHNKSAIVTGGSQGLGLQLAKGLLKNGANVLICGRSFDTLQKSYKILEPNLFKNQKLKIFKCDVSDEIQVKDMINEAKKDFFKVDILVNNAGVYGPKGVFEESNLDDWKNAFDINFYGSILPITLTTFFNSSIRLSLLCRRPAVSAIRTSTCFAVAD